MRLLRADEMNVGVETARGEDQPFAGDDLGGDADHHVLRDAGHDIRIACLADAGNQAAFDADVGLVDSGVVHDEGIGDDAVERVGITDAGRLSHAFANDFSAAKFAFVAIRRVVLLDLENE